MIFGWVGFARESGDSEAVISIGDPKMSTSGCLYSGFFQTLKRKFNYHPEL